LGSFAFYPMNLEPEAALMVLSPSFNNQVAAIDLVSKALPAGVPLVVKENIVSLGKRPPGLYEWLSALPNVVLAPFAVPGKQLASRSALTVTVTGTAGMEAALAGTPVACFGRHNLYSTLPHVRVLDRISSIDSDLRELIEAGETKRAEWSEIARDFYGSFVATCFEQDDLNSPQTVKNMWMALRATLPKHLASG
jgi:hypothetical protein